MSLKVILELMFFHTKCFIYFFLSNSYWTTLSRTTFSGMWVLSLLLLAYLVHLTLSCVFLCCLVVVGYIMRDIKLALVDITALTLCSQSVCWKYISLLCIFLYSYHAILTIYTTCKGPRRMHYVMDFIPATAIEIGDVAPIQTVG